MLGQVVLVSSGFEYYKIPFGSKCIRVLNFSTSLNVLFCYDIGIIISINLQFQLILGVYELVYCHCHSNGFSSPPSTNVKSLIWSPALICLVRATCASIIWFTSYRIIKQVCHRNHVGSFSRNWVRGQLLDEDMILLCNYIVEAWIPPL